VSRRLQKREAGRLKIGWKWAWIDWKLTGSLEVYKERPDV